MRFGSSVKLAPFRLFGYSFDYIGDDSERQRFMAVFKESVPLKMWDPGAKRWWIPELYAHIAESVAVEHGALSKLALEQAHRLRLRATREDIVEAYNDLHLLSTAPQAVVHAAIAHYRSAWADIPVAEIERQRIEAAYARIIASWEKDEEVPM